MIFTTFFLILLAATAYFIYSNTPAAKEKGMFKKLASAAKKGSGTDVEEAITNTLDFFGLAVPTEKGKSVSHLDEGIPSLLGKAVEYDLKFRKTQPMLTSKAIAENLEGSLHKIGIRNFDAILKIPKSLNPEALLKAKTRQS